MTLSKFFIFLLIILLLTSPLYTEKKDEFRKLRRNPILSGALSWYCPGLGQLYSGNYFRAGFFYFSETTLLISSLIVFFGDINFSLGSNLQLSIQMELKKMVMGMIEPWRFYTALSLFINLGILHIVNIIDAVRGTLMRSRKQLLSDKLFYFKVENNSVMVCNTIKF